MTARILFVPHGGGPMPLLHDPEHAALTAFLQAVPDRLGTPEAILVISAHWEMPAPHVTAGTAPELIYDYGGFPPEAYEIRYPAPGEPGLARESLHS
jgi:4,5-DOPA dioxygenase extradiol